MWKCSKRAPAAGNQSTDEQIKSQTASMLHCLVHTTCLTSGSEPGPSRDPGACMDPPRDRPTATPNRMAFCSAPVPEQTAPTDDLLFGCCLTAILFGVLLCCCLQRRTQTVGVAGAVPPPPSLVAGRGSPNRTWFCSGVCYRTDAQQTRFCSIVVRVLGSGSRVCSRNGRNSHGTRARWPYLEVYMRSS